MNEKVIQLTRSEYEEKKAEAKETAASEEKKNK